METLLRRRTSGAASSDFFKGCLHETRNEIDPRRNLNAPQKDPIYITFNYARNEIKFCFGDGPKKTAHSAKTSHSCFDEINACADVSFRMISFRLVFT